jgi:hypothetical protein
MKRLLSVALMVLVTLVGMVGFSRAGNEVSALQATANTTNETVSTLQAQVNAGVPVKPKMYYLTKNSFDGGDAIKACDPRFHMASISEIQDPSHLQYANRSTTVYDSLVDDQSLGPPANHMGWVRSGIYPPSGFVYDCEDFQDIRDNHAGTTLVFKDSSEVGAKQTVYTPTAWWQAARQPCTQPEPVWCVEDPE